MEMMKKLKFTGVGLAILILLCASPGAALFSAGAVSAAPNGELCQECQLCDPEPEFEYPIMRPSREERLRWIEGYNRAPKAHVSDKISRELDLSPEGSQSLLDHLEYTPSQRDQGSCGNCWAWAGTGVMEIALDVQDSLKDRLSMQYLNSNYNGGSGSNWACCGGWLEDVADFYTSTGQAIPWSNTNANWQDGGRTCGSGATIVPAGNISTTPNYAITSITDQTVSTQGMAQSTAIANIKNVLDQNKAVWFGYFLPTTADWDNFRNFWNNESESVIWDPDLSCGHTWDAGGGGHAVLCVGYNDEAGTANDYWVMLNSWGTASGGRPNGLFRLAMDMNYDCAHYDDGWYYSFYWQTLDINYEAVGGGGTTLDKQVSQSSDDCARLYHTDYWSATCVWQNAGRTVAAYPDYSGAFRLQNITIPKGATITQAYFSIKGRNSDSGTTVRSRIRAQAADNPATFSTSADFDARTWTDETVYWDNISAWTAGNWYNSPDIKTIVQAIVNRANWQSGNAIVICWDDWQKRSTQSDYRIRRGRSYDYAAADAPKLHIEYEEAAAAPTVTNSTGATNITSNSARLNGEVTDTGGEDPTVHIYWGETDEGTTAENWDNPVDDLGTKGAETFYKDISSLTSSTTYYYRCYATNSNGNDWADSTESFATLAPPSAPTVTNSTGASSVTDSSARLNGEITSTGGEDPTVHIYWGETDEGTTAGNWDNHVDDLGTKGAETFYEDISSLTASTTYYYRCYATNSGGNDWADSTESFVTLAEATTLDRQVSQSSDDCARLYHTDYWNTTANWQSAGRTVAAYPDYGGAFRLQNITIPKGATITQAYFSIKARNSDSATTVRSRIRAQAADNPAVFSTSADFDARTWTDETVYWDSIPAWTTGNWYNSPDIKTIVQTIVNRANWQSGNAIVICWEDWQKRSTQNNYVIRRGRSYNYAAADAPKLHIEYTVVPPDPPGAPTLVSPGASITFKWNASSGATKYHLQVNTLANFTGTDMFNAELGDVTSQEVTGLSVGTTYYWQVKAGNDGGWSDWSSVRSVLANTVT